MHEDHQPVGLPDFMGAASFAIVFGPTDFVIVSVEPEAPEHVSITGGVLKSVSSDRHMLLQYCNTETANNAGMPIYAHGEDVLLQKRTPIAVIARVPELLSIQIDDIPPYAAEKRNSWLRDGIAGEPFEWGGPDLQRLHMKATTPAM